MKEKPWNRIPRAVGGKCAARYRLLDTGYIIAHCGHPTALWPYYGQTPDGEIILAANGHGFHNLAAAKQAMLDRYLRDSVVVAPIASDSFTPTKGTESP